MTGKCFHRRQEESNGGLGERVAHFGAGHYGGR